MIRVHCEGLEHSFTMHSYYFTIRGMPEFQIFRMEAEAFGWLSVEGIAHDGTVHSVGVGGVHTELVGASGLGVVGDAGSFFGCFVS